MHGLSAFRSEARAGGRTLFAAAVGLAFGLNSIPFYTLGVFALLSPALVFVAIGVWLLIAGRTKVPALGSLSGVGAATVYSLVTGQPADITVLALATTVLIIYTHRVNLAKLVFTTVQ